MIAFGHPPAAVWEYSLRQAVAFLKLAEARRREDLAQQLSTAALAARGEPDAIKAYIRDLMRGT